MEYSQRFCLVQLPILIGGVLLAQSVLANKYSVCQYACDFPTIQAAVDFAQNGDTINISNGTYLEDITIKDKSLHLKGEDMNQTIINGTGPVSVIMLECMDDSTAVIISNLSVTGVTTAPRWAIVRSVGINNNQCNLTVKNTTIYNNTDINGPPSDYVNAGGGLVTSGHTVMKNSSVIDNYSITGPGGIWITEGGSLVLKNSVIARNVNGCGPHTDGGGIYNDGGDLIIIDSEIRDNGIGFYCDGSGISNRGSLVIKDSLISGNRGYTGGIVNDGDAEISNCIIEEHIGFTAVGIMNVGNLTIRSSTVTNNSAAMHSGIENYWPGTVHILSSEITNNDGGGIFNAGVMEIRSSNITDNKFTLFSQGGGIYNSDELSIHNSVISGNGSPDDYPGFGEGGGIYNVSTGTITASKTTIEGNLPDNCGGYGYTCP